MRPHPITAVGKEQERQQQGRPGKRSGLGLVCVAGGIVSARKIKFWRRSREENTQARLGLLLVTLSTSLQ